METSPPIYIATTIYNPTDDTIRFLTMTCSYEDFFLTDTADFKVQQDNLCYSNYPTFITLPPKSKTDRYITVRSAKTNFTPADYVKYKIKIGMYLITWTKNLKYRDQHDLYENRQKAEIIWSNDLELNKLYREIYK